MIKIIVSGAGGKMGSTIIRLIKTQSDLKLVGALESDKFAFLGKDIGEVIGIGKIGVETISDLTKIINEGDVVIDFSLPSVTLKNVEISAKNKKAMVIGTTGFKDEEKEKIKKLSKIIPIVLAPNMSIGVNLLFKLVQEATKVLKDKDFDIEIVEAHHRFKKDAPSGTALKFASIIAEEKGIDLKKAMVSGREGITGERDKNSIGIFAVRAGDIVGEHTVTFGSLGERIELTHKAHSRDTFARGAIVAARFVMHSKPSLYDMQDVLGIK
ncbi:MAG: 4-hydroxy-tetrahydrodipicolinate reductase [Candidatus Firestonebacteria bacterium]